MRDATDFVDDGRRKGVRRKHHAGITGVHARVFDVLEHAADDGRLAVGDGVDIELDGIFEELIEQHRLAWGDVEGFAHDGL